MSNILCFILGTAFKSLFSKIDFSVSHALKASILLLALGSFPAAGSGLPDEVSVSIVAAHSEFSREEKLMISVVYKNTADEAVRFLRWGTALEGRINENFLSVYYEGEELPYAGWIIKRSPPTSDDYIALNPDQEVVVDIDLSTGYDLSFKGVYDISLRTPHSHEEYSAKQGGSVSITLAADRLFLEKQTPAVAACPDDVSGLPNDRFSLIDQSVAFAERITLVARDDLANTPVDQRENANRYREWFGTYTAARWNTVQDHFNRIFSAVSAQQLSFECEDNESFYAAVYPNNPYHIFLGRAFWSAPFTGTDSKAGTIVHELSHFNVLGGTDDHVYGQSGARSLAISNPGLAVDNADSHEYFAENTPFLTMPEPEVDQPDQADSNDIQLTSVSVANESPMASSTTAIGGSVVNNGDVSLSSINITAYLSSNASISASDAEIGATSFSTLNAGVSRTFEINALIPEQESLRYIGVCATASSSEGTKQVCSSGIEIDIQDSVTIAPIINLLLDE